MPHKNKNKEYRTGFSLVELSIVLVILGLLTGGILGGQALIKAAELRAVTTEFNQWQTAVNTFQDKYMAIPGDMKNATQFWGTDSGCGTNGAGGNTTPGYQGGDSLDGTCNGDGTGRVGNNNTISAYYEHFLFWQHLSLAGLISGDYTGVRSGGASGNHNSHGMGENSPKSKFSSAGWSVGSMTIPNNKTWMQVEYENYLLIGGATGGEYFAGSLAGEDAWNIDTKIDDGLPGRGHVLGVVWTQCSTAGSDTDFDGAYVLDETANCALQFRKVF